MEEESTDAATGGEKLFSPLASDSPPTSKNSRQNNDKIYVSEFPELPCETYESNQSETDLRIPSEQQQNYLDEGNFDESETAPEHLADNI